MYTMLSSNPQAFIAGSCFQLAVEAVSFGNSVTGQSPSWQACQGQQPTQGADVEQASRHVLLVPCPHPIVDLRQSALPLVSFSRPCITHTYP